MRGALVASFSLLALVVCDRSQAAANDTNHHTIGDLRGHLPPVDRRERFHSRDRRVRRSAWSRRHDAVGLCPLNWLKSFHEWPPRTSKGTPSRSNARSIQIAFSRLDRDQSPRL